MAARDYYDPPENHANTAYSRTQPPHLPPLSETQHSFMRQDAHVDSPVSPIFDTTPLHGPGKPTSDSRSDFFSNTTGPYRTSRQYSDEIPLRDDLQPGHGYKPDASDSQIPLRPTESPEQVASEPRRRRRREPEKRGWFSGKIPWVVYFLTVVQIAVFIAELAKNGIETGIPIQTQPQINPMIGPSYYVLINMGGRYIPCMKNISYLGLPSDINWPCPNSTTSDPTSPSMHCSLQDLCGFPPLGDPPNQWFRFIIPMFLHAGIIHIGFNLLLQLTLGREMEKTIGSLRFLLVYLSSGIFGFVLGGNYAASGIVSLGCSGSLFGIVAINLLDLLYTWRERVSPWKELIFIVIDILISFALGLLPGLDNFSHLGGFLMGLVLGVCILHSPNILRETNPSASLESPVTAKGSRRRRRPSYKSFRKEPLNFFKDRKLGWWTWWLVRAGALLGVLVCFIILINNFYKYGNTCSWCKYLSCINVNNWCNVGNLQDQITNTTSNKRDLFGTIPLDLQNFM